MLREQTDTRLVTVVAVILRQTPLLSFQGYEVKDTNIPSKQCSAQRRNPGEKRGAAGQSFNPRMLSLKTSKRDKKRCMMKLMIEIRCI